MFVIIYFAFVQLGFLLFGIQVSKLHFQGVRNGGKFKQLKKRERFENEKWRNLTINNGGKFKHLKKTKII